MIITFILHVNVPKHIYLVMFSSCLYMQGCASVSLVTACTAAATFYGRLGYHAIKQVPRPECTVYFMTKDVTCHWCATLLKHSRIESWVDSGTILRWGDGATLVPITVKLFHHRKYNGDTGYKGGWPSARLFGWSAVDWSRPGTN